MGKEHAKELHYLPYTGSHFHGCHTGLPLRQTGQQEQNGTEESPEDILGSLLTGGAGKESEDVTDVLKGYLNGGSIREDQPLQGTVQTDQPLHEETDIDWLAGVCIDPDGRIAREGYGRIDFDTDPADKDMIIGAVVLDSYTYAATALNCQGVDGHVSFLLPEGTYYVCLCINGSGMNQTELWPYTTNGSFEKISSITVFAEVEVKDGQITTLPAGDVS